MANHNDFRREVKIKLAHLNWAHPDDLARVIYFLDEADRHDRETGEVSPYWGNFEILLNADAAFEGLARRYAADTRTAERNPQFLRVMRDIYDFLLKQNDDEVPLSAVQGFDLELAIAKSVTSAAGGLVQSWNKIHAESQKQLLEYLPKALGTSLRDSINEIISSSKYVSKLNMMYALAAVYMTYQAAQNINKWWHGKISGERCAKNIIGELAQTVGGIAGGVGGAALGLLLLPNTLVIVGGIIGSFLGFKAAKLLSDRLTQCLFGLPRDEAVENAYRYLGVEPEASNTVINRAFRELCLRHHPDRGGDPVDFHFLQYNMEVIREARGESLRVTTHNNSRGQVLPPVTRLPQSNQV